MTPHTLKRGIPLGAAVLGAGWLVLASAPTVNAQGDPLVTGSGSRGRSRPVSEEITMRLTRRIDRLVVLFPPGGSKVRSGTLVDSLADSDIRTQLFRLESLLRLYRRQFSNLDGPLRRVKEVEDGLGAYAYAVESRDFARDTFKKDTDRRVEQERILEGLAKKEAMARDALAKLLDRGTLGSELPRLRSLVVSRLAGWDSANDLGYVKRELQRMLSDVRERRFNFKKLEDGIHDFRRQLRWFPITIDALDGLILVRDDPAGACPVRALEALAGSAAAEHRYANPALRFPATHPCMISRCLLWQVSKTVRDMGRLLNEAHGHLAIDSVLLDDVDIALSNDVTPEQTARAERIRTELYSSRALESLSAQLSSCKL